MDFDFSGYATKNDLACSDGRTIRKDAFKKNDGETVPLVWQHTHNDPANVLGHALLENREDGVYAFGKFNETEAGKNARQLVKHGDIKSLSIFAGGLIQNGANVVHGAIREVSLVLSGANPGALIDNLNIAHSDGSYDVVDDEAIIYTGLDITQDFVAHKKNDDDNQNGSKKDKDDEKTVRDVFNTMSEDQKNVVYAMVAQAASGADDDDDDDDNDDDDDDVQHNYEGGYNMKNNVFDNSAEPIHQTLSHAQIEAIMEDARETGSLKESFLYHAGQYGIDNIDVLFPDAKTVTPTPHFIKREDDWVAGVISGTRHTPFSRIKSTAADITADEARALGYVKKGNLKKEEVINLLKRVTTPTTIYKKQKLDRDDIIDITDLDVVSWLKAEMRMMLDEELARAVLIGDGRDAESMDKIQENHIRPIATDDEMYAHRVTLENDVDTDGLIEAIIRSRKHYKGQGVPKFYTTTDILTDMLLLKDQMGRRMYSGVAEIKSMLRVSDIVEVPVMENETYTNEALETTDLIGIIVNLNDYSLGADKGGQVSMFDDFDIDYNQYKYLMETRCSGALTRPKSALVIEKKQADPIGG